MEASPPQRPVPSSSEDFPRVRDATEVLCAPLQTEDYVIQSMPDVSPTKWHLAHTSWFFEAFLLQPFDSEYTVSHPTYGYLFNSYYNVIGERHPRGQRGLASRPTVAEVYAYRHGVDERMLALLAREADSDMLAVADLGLHHEQQHQELLLTDIKHVFWMNPLRPAYRQAAAGRFAPPPPMHWFGYPETIIEIGHAGNDFAFDNERPRHRTLISAFSLASRLVTNGEYRAFMEDGGYERPDLWLSDGWRTAQERAWKAPLYWEYTGGDWGYFTLSGMQPVDLNEPICHVSYYEADAYARWAGARLPTESEWEHVASTVPISGNFVESGLFHPMAMGSTALSIDDAPFQLFGDVWEWTSSPYVGYPGFRPLPGAAGEYNGKFMSNQMVLRGGSCATPASHIRSTYRNFFPSDTRWQFSGFRLARDE